MSTKLNISSTQTAGGLKTGFETGGLQTGFEPIDIPENFEIPSCGIEDVDRALFKLFNQDLPLFFEKAGEIARIPCVFAGGERAIILRKKEALRDRQGALILPLVSILRNGIDQMTENKAISAGDGTITIRKRLAPEDREYKRLSNDNGLRNQDNVVGSALSSNTSLQLTNKNVFEIITMPSPKFFKSTYEITFWAQYIQQMNHMIEALITSYNIQPARSFRIESDKGYWFVATVESGLSDGSNFDSYVDEERIIRTSLTIEVTGYVVNPKYPGAPNPFRRYISAPKVQFETTTDVPSPIASSNIPSGKPEDYVFSDFDEDGLPLPGRGVAQTSIVGSDYAVNIGGMLATSDKQGRKLLTNVETNLVQPTETVNLTDPFTGEPSKATVKSKNLSKGESVYIIIDTLN
jgi:hypothetical protein